MLRGVSGNIRLNRLKYKAATQEEWSGSDEELRQITRVSANVGQVIEAMTEFEKNGTIVRPAPNYSELLSQWNIMCQQIEDIHREVRKMGTMLNVFGEGDAARR